MQGLAAINAHNGWAMAVAGALIVMSGLSCLAFIISQLHRIITLFEKKDVPSAPVQKIAPEPVEPEPSKKGILHDLNAAARLYSPLSSDLGQTFELVQLYEIFNNENVPHPHITIRAFREAGILAPAEEGFFSWKNV